MVEYIKFLIVLSIADDNERVKLMIQWEERILGDNDSTYNEKHRLEKQEELRNFYARLERNRELLREINGEEIEVMELAEKMWPSIHKFLVDNPQFYSFSLTNIVTDKSLQKDVEVLKWGKKLYEVQSKSWDSIYSADFICQNKSYPIYGMVNKLFGNKEEQFDIIVKIYKDLISDGLFDPNFQVSNRLFWTELPNPFRIGHPELADYNTKVVLHPQTNYCSKSNGSDSLVKYLVKADDSKASSLERKYYFNLFSQIVLERDISIIEAYRNSGTGTGTHYGLVRHIFGTNFPNIEKELKQLQKKLLTSSEVDRQISLLRYYIPDIRFNVNTYIDNIRESSVSETKEEDIQKLEKLLW